MIFLDPQNIVPYDDITPKERIYIFFLQNCIIFSFVFISMPCEALAVPKLVRLPLCDELKFPAYILSLPFSKAVLIPVSKVMQHRHLQGPVSHCGGLQIRISDQTGL